MAVPRVVRILERLARRPTAPFHEERVAAEATEIARASAATVRRDPSGNLVVSPAGRRQGRPIWLVAHMDHPGLEVVGRGEALLLGGLRADYFRRGTRLRFYHEGEIVAATLTKATRRGQRWRFRIRGRAVGRLRHGDFGVWELPDFRVAAGRVHARQLDDLVGCATSLAAMERVSASRTLNVKALLTRAEEVGMVGTLAAIRDGTIPRGAWIVNIEASRAIPGVTIGGGPVIRVGDRMRTFDAGAEALLAAARDRLPKRKPVQRALMTGGACEATAWSAYGYAATGIAIPLGNYHNQGPRDRLAPEYVAAKDLATAVDLVELAARNVPRALRSDADLRRRLDRRFRSFAGRLPG